MQLLHGVVVTRFERQAPVLGVVFQRALAEIASRWIDSTRVEADAPRLIS
jgi:hypothetical protein